MSRLYDALRHAQKERVAKNASKTSEPSPAARAGSERRRSHRVSISLPILVYGRSESGEPFHEETRTLQVSPNGCSFTSETQVTLEQRLMIISQNKDREQLARVVYIKARKPQPTEIGVEFLERRPDFWPVGFPPE
jgi:hypothetical protein